MDANFQQVDTNKFLIIIPNAESINHVVVFLTGLSSLPNEAAACIFFSLPDATAAPTWIYLGYLSNEKPSAIYKLTNLTQSKLRGLAVNGATNSNSLALMTNNNSPAFNYAQSPVLQAQIGISIEPMSLVSGLVPAIETTASKETNFSEFINKTVSNLYNYCCSFSKSASELVASQNPFQSRVTLGGDSQYVPLKTIQTWYENYTRRLSNDTDFWKSLQQN